MKILLPCLPLLLAAALAAEPAAKSREETIALVENRTITVSVPAGFTYAVNRGPEGPLGFRLADAKERFSLDCVFLPDPEGMFANARSRKEKLVEMFESYVESSAEKGMRFEELEPRTGAGTYCVFTDAALVGKTAYPPGEFLHLTAGVKAWPGVVAVFRFFSNDTSSPEYQAVLRMLRESVDEKPAPLK